MSKRKRASRLRTTYYRIRCSFCNTTVVVAERAFDQLEVISFNKGTRRTLTFDCFECESALGEAGDLPAVSTDWDVLEVLYRG